MAPELAQELNEVTDLALVAERELLQFQVSHIQQSREVSRTKAWGYQQCYTNATGILLASKKEDGHPSVRLTGPTDTLSC